MPETALALEEAARTGRPLLPVLKKRAPYLYRQIARDRRCPGLFSLWGRCVNFDENARQIIVHPAIHSAIAAIAGVPMRGRFVHAGLQHTYGYLLSVIETPYGFKRERWVSTEMERGFGLEESLLGENPREGTLLANLTCWLGNIVCPGSRLDRLIESRGAVAHEIANYDFNKLERQRIVEIVRADRAEFRLLTDLVLFSKARAGAANTTLLIYSIRSGARPIRLITAFPVSDQTVKNLIAELPASGRGGVRLRYNAYVPRLFGRTIAGRRYLEIKAAAT